MKSLPILVILLLLFSFVSASQNYSQIYNIKNDTILSLYESSLHTQYDYIVGKEYKPYHYYKQDNPYLNSSLGSGYIYNNGRSYHTKIIYYDLFTDEVIININNKATNSNLIQIEKTQIDSFSINFGIRDYNFTYLKKPNNISSGFYEIVYNQKFKLLIRHTAKKLKTKSLTTYKHKQIIYLKRNKTFHDIGSPKKFLSLFPESNKLLRKKLRLLEINFKKPSHSKLINLIKYAETL
ncbi:hypothetical protein [Marinifilum fragile]|uniref:hypothetical protein n=1 Tax=Marinifilum fragile TaxID=570161 RepID=UPI002AA80AB7|nr:hypothetical protein [Marinifilum fragile]